MVDTLHSPQTNRWLGEKRVTLSGLDWQAYQQIATALPATRGARLTYDRGDLEITMPSEEHEFYLRLIERFIIILVVEMGLKVKTMGSTRLERADRQRGSEPDCAYYIQNQALVAGRSVNLASDPPPDLVVEVDLTRADLDKNSLYAALGIAELWRYDGREWRIFQLGATGYVEGDRSPTFPGIEKELLAQFLARAQQDEVAAEQHLRAAVRSRLQSEGDRP